MFQLAGSAEGPQRRKPLQGGSVAWKALTGCSRNTKTVTVFRREVSENRKLHQSEKWIASSTASSYALRNQVPVCDVTPRASMLPLVLHLYHTACQFSDTSSGSPQRDEPMFFVPVKDEIPRARYIANSTVLSLV